MLKQDRASFACGIAHFVLCPGIIRCHNQQQLSSSMATHPLPPYYKISTSKYLYFIVSQPYFGLFHTSFSQKSIFCCGSRVFVNTKSISSFLLHLRQQQILAFRFRKGSLATQRHAIISTFSSSSRLLLSSFLQDSSHAPIVTFPPSAPLFNTFACAIFHCQSFSAQKSTVRKLIFPPNSKVTVFGQDVISASLALKTARFYSSHQSEQLFLLGFLALRLCYRLTSRRNLKNPHCGIYPV